MRNTARGLWFFCRNRGNELEKTVEIWYNQTSVPVVLSERVIRFRMFCCFQEITNGDFWFLSGVDRVKDTGDRKENE